MTDQEIREMLKECTNMTKHDIEQSLKDGVFVYESFEEYFDHFKEWEDDEEEARRVWDMFDKYFYNGKEIRVDFAT